MIPISSMSSRNITALARETPGASHGGSAIELRFARIARELTARWHGSDIDNYLDSLLIDTRGSRMGFPPEVLEEIMFLAGVRWNTEKTPLPANQEGPQIVHGFYKVEAYSQRTARVPTRTA